MAVTSGSEVGLGAVLVRATVPVGAALVLLAGTRVEPVSFFLLVVGALLAVVRPATVGAWVVLPAAVWSFAVTTTGDVGVGRVLLAAAGVYLLHTGTAAAAACPHDARLDSGVVTRWLIRCLPAVVLTAAVAGLDAVLTRTPDNGLFLAAVGVLVLAAVVVLVRLLAATRDG